jgi:hypothetical protein
VHPISNHSSRIWSAKVFSVLNELKVYRRTVPARRRLLWEALFALAVARIAMACMPFRRIAAWLGTPGTESPEVAPQTQIESARQIGWAVAVLARRVPWDGRCLAQALAASWMLRRRGLEGTVSLGAGRDSSRQFAAHAWLRFGPCWVTGGAEHGRFQTLTSFARKTS